MHFVRRPAVEFDIGRVTIHFEEMLAAVVVGFAERL
jgi:hypothetical protein